MVLSRSRILLAVVALQALVSENTAFLAPSSLSSFHAASVSTPTNDAMVFPSQTVVQKQPQPSSSLTKATTKTTATPTTTTLFSGGLELVDPSYNLALGAFGIGLAAGFLEDLRDGEGEKLLTAKPFGGLALLFTLFSLFLAFQTTTLRFAFDEDSFSLVSSNGARLEQENVVVGGENKWKYSSFSNYDFLPSRDFPILVYFREDQTPVENREEVPIVVDTLEGQVHFFPAISNTKQLEDGFLEHNCKHL